MTDDVIEIAPEDVAVIDMNTKAALPNTLLTNTRKKSIGLL